MKVDEEEMKNQGQGGILTDDPLVDGNTELPVEGGGMEPEDQAPKAPGWHNQVREYFSDKELSDEEIDESAESMISELMDYQRTGREANAKLIEIFEAEPEIASFMSDLMKGASIPVAIARNFDLDGISPQEGEPDYGEWEAAAQSRRNKAKESIKYQEELTANKVESSKAFSDFEEEKGMSEEEADAFIDKVEGFLADIYRGRVSKEFLDAMYKATDYETALTNTRKEAELKGKNANVELQKKNYSKPKGDGLPEVKATGGATDTPKKVKPRFMQSLDEIEEREKRRV